MAKPQLVHHRDTDLGGGKHLYVAQRGIDLITASGERKHTDTSWHDLLDTWNSGDTACAVSFVKSTRTVTLDWGDGVTLGLSPYNGRNPSSWSMVGNTLTFVRLWTGITLTATLTPEGLHLAYTRTASTIVNPAWTVTGTLADVLRGGEGYTDANGDFIAVPTTYTSGRYTINMSGVPVGVTVE